MSYTIGVFKRETRDYCLETGIDIGELLESNSEKAIEFDEKDYQFLEEYFKMPAYSGKWEKKSEENSEVVVYDNMEDVSVEIYRNSIIFKTGWSNSFDLLMITGDIVLLSKESFQRFNFQEGGWDEKIPRSELVSQEKSGDIDIVSIVEGFKSTIFKKKDKRTCVG